MSEFYKSPKSNFDFAKALNQALNKSGKSQYWLAKELDVSQPYVSKISAGYTVPSIPKTEMIASVLGFKLSEFIVMGE